MYAGRVACCFWWVCRRNRRVDRRTDTNSYISLSAKRGQRNKYICQLCYLTLVKNTNFSFNLQCNTSIRPSSETAVHPHMPIVRPTRGAIFHERRISIGRIGQRAGHADSSDFGFLGGAKFPKMWDSLPWTPMNRRVKFDAVGFILGGEIRIRTIEHTYTEKNKQ